MTDFDPTEDLITLRGRSELTAEEQYDLFMTNAIQSGEDIVWTDTSGDYTARLSKADLDDLTVDHFSEAPDFLVYPF
ncbi:hypothetical protein AAD018_008420 [Aestuariibius insulae]|uniref:hypothetical protein n=1 Tax=Aestuariibius insulae TaxID=2058287 RepID=UPI00345E796B